MIFPLEVAQLLSRFSRTDRRFRNIEVDLKVAYTIPLKTMPVIEEELQKRPTVISAQNIVL